MKKEEERELSHWSTLTERESDIPEILTYGGTTPGVAPGAVAGKHTTTQENGGDHIPFPEDGPKDRRTG